MNAEFRAREKNKRAREGFLLVAAKQASERASKCVYLSIARLTNERLDESALKQARATSIAHCSLTCTWRLWGAAMKGAIKREPRWRPKVRERASERAKAKERAIKGERARCESKNEI